MNDEEIYDPMTGMKLWPIEDFKQQLITLTDEQINYIADELGKGDKSFEWFEKTILEKLRENNS